MDNRASTVKTSLLAVCKDYVNQRIANAQEAITAASEAAADDTKSSAGDKFETTREMMQQELNRHHQLLADAKRMSGMLNTLEARTDTGPVKPGSLVTTNQGCFFIAISMGQCQIEGQSYWVISPASPLGQRLIGLEVGEQLTFGGTVYQVMDIT